MTRQELADAVNAQVYRLSGEVTTIDANHIGKWERGVIRWPAERYRTALRTLCATATDGQLGFQSPRARCDGDDVDRKTFLKTMGLGTGAVLATPFAAEAQSGDLVATIAGPTQHYRRMEATVSSHQLAPAVDSHQLLAATVVDEQLRTPTSYAALSEIAGLSAWLAIDRGDTAAARKRYAEAIRYAETAEHPLLVAYMLGSLAQYVTDIGEPQQGLRLLNQAAGHFDHTTPPPARAWLSALIAVAQASAGEHKAATEAIRAAGHRADREPGDVAWPWVFAFTSGKVARYESSALIRLGDRTGARTAYSTAVASITAPKAQALVQAEYAQLLATHGEADEALALATEALDTGKRYDSERVITQVRTLRAALPDSANTRTLDTALLDLYREDSR